MHEGIAVALGVKPWLQILTNSGTVKVIQSIEIFYVAPLN